MQATIKNLLWIVSRIGLSKRLGEESSAEKGCDGMKLMIVIIVGFLLF